MSSITTANVCKYCNNPEDKQSMPCFVCQLCSRLVHLSCLRGDPPSPLAGDVIFDFTCADCSHSNNEVFFRGRMIWAYALILTLHQLIISSAGISNHGFFHYKTHISWFIDRNWKKLFGSQFKQKKNWIGTLVGTLSSHSGLIFQSSAAVLGEQGWWRLKHNLSPAVLVHIIQEMARDKAENIKLRKKNEERPLKTLEQIVSELGYTHLLNESPAPISEVLCKKRKTETDGQSATLQHQLYDNNIDSDSSYDMGDDKITAALTKKSKIENDMKHEENLVLPSAPLSFPYPGQLPAPNDDSDSRSCSPPAAASNVASMEDSDGWNSAADDRNKMSEQKLEPPQIDLNETSLFSNERNSIGPLPWLRQIDEPDKSLVRLTEYEEIHLLKRVESMISDITHPADKAYLRRFRAKLAIRRLKRNRHLPLFDLDKTVKYLGGYSSKDPSADSGNKERVLDRFQASYLCGSTPDSVSTTILVGHTDCTPFQSPYSGSILKPFIRRDTESSPLWLRLMDELLQKTNANNANYVPRERAPIDYSYVKPQHIAAVNNLCAQFFWPGVDLTESLQYPEFSCVVTYRKLVVGFAFLVPDAGRSMAYISFVLTRPEWRRSNIATFMLYHLLQTCTGQDVTLHVSPTNPAVFLYQKFGFKVEELVQDFYEKYFNIDSKDCKHALLLRLTR